MGMTPLRNEATMWAAFADELVKASARRVNKEVLRNLEGHIPGLTKEWKSFARQPREPTGPSSLSDFLLLRKSEPAVRQVVDDTSSTYLGARLPRLLSPSVRLKTRPLDLAEQKLDTITRYSGRHAPSAGEVLIPTGAGPLNVHPQDTAHATHIFRGNPLGTPSKETPKFLSRHPGVAGQYTASNIPGQRTASTGRLYAYDPKQLQLLGDAPADAWAYSRSYKPKIQSGGSYEDMVNLRGEGKAEAARLVESIRRTEHPSNYDQIAHSSIHPTYENIAVGGDPSAPAGEYRVRRSRTQSGLPALAVRDVAGIPAAAMFNTKISAKLLDAREGDVPSTDVTGRNGNNWRSPGTGGLVYAIHPSEAHRDIVAPPQYIALSPGTTDSRIP